MSTIEEMNNNMSIFYYKSNGDINSICSGIQPTKTFFGKHSLDMMQIIDSIVLPIDSFVLKNSQNYKVNIDTKQLEMLLSVNKYPVAK